MSPVRATVLQLSLDLQLRTLQLSRYARSKRSLIAQPAWTMPRVRGGVRDLTRSELERRLAEAETEGAQTVSTLEVERSRREACEAAAAKERRHRQGDESVLAAHAEAVAETERLKAKLRVAGARLREENDGTSAQEAASRVAEEQEAVRRTAEAERIRTEREAHARRLRDAERGREAAEAALAAEQRGCAAVAYGKVAAERKRLERIHADEKRKLEEALARTRREMAAAAQAAERESLAVADAQKAKEQASRAVAAERRVESLSRRLHAERTARAAAEVRLEVSAAAQATARAESEPLELLVGERGRLGVRFHEGEGANDGLVVESVLPAGLVARCAADAVLSGAAGRTVCQIGAGSLLLCINDDDISEVPRQQALAILADAMPHRPLRLVFGPEQGQGPEGGGRHLPPPVDTVVCQRLEKAVAAQAHAEAALEQEAEERRHAEAALKNARAEKHIAEEEAASARMQLGSLEQQGESADTRVAAVEHELEQQQASNARMREEKAAAGEEARVATASLESAESLMREEAAGRATVNEQLQALQVELDASRASVAKIQAQVGRQEQDSEIVRAAEDRARQAEATALAAEIESQRRQHEAELRAVTSARDAAKAELAAEQTRREAAGKRTAEAEAKCDEARAAASVAHRECAAAEERATTQRREREAAEKMIISERGQRQQPRVRPVARAVASTPAPAVAAPRTATVRAGAGAAAGRQTADEKFIAEQRALGLLDSSDDDSSPLTERPLPATPSQYESPVASDPAGRMAQLARQADRLVPTSSMSSSPPSTAAAPSSSTNPYMRAAGGGTGPPPVPRYPPSLSPQSRDREGLLGTVSMSSTGSTPGGEW